MKIDDVVILTGLVMFVGGTIVQLVLIPRSVRHRTDVRPGGNPLSGNYPFWQLNLIDPRNYRGEDGRRFHRNLVIAVVVQLLGGLIYLPGSILLDG